MFTIEIAWCAIDAYEACETMAASIPSALVPAEITLAHKVFMSNAGADLTSWQYFKKDGDTNLPFDGF